MKTNKQLKMLLYRSEFLRAAKSVKNVSLDKIYEDTRISINTQRKAFAGENLPILTLKNLADYLGVDWIKLFDLHGEISRDAITN